MKVGFRMTWLTVALLAAADLAAVPNTCRPAALFGVKDANGNPYWDAAWNRQKKAIAASDSFDLVLVGDSISANFDAEGRSSHFNGEPKVLGAKVAKTWFAGFKYLNLGIGGDGPSQILYRLQNGQLDGYRAKVFSLMAGTNCGPGDSAEDVAAGVKLLATTILEKHPEAVVLLSPILPRFQREGGVDYNPRNAAANKILATACDGTRMIWFDAWTRKLLGADGNPDKAFYWDWEHVSDKGYELWARALVREVKKAVKPQFGKFDRSKFHIGTLRFQDNGMRDERHVRDLAAAGIDFVVGLYTDTSDRAKFTNLLDLFRKYGVQCICESGADIAYALPQIGDGRFDMAKKRPAEMYVQAAERLFPHPAIVGVDIFDEPDPFQFEHLGKCIAALRPEIGDAHVWVNLLPNYNGWQPGEKFWNFKYDTMYIEPYMRQVPLDYISVDIYPYADGWGRLKEHHAGIRYMFENMRVLNEACVRYGRSLFLVMQANSYDGTDVTNSDHDLPCLKSGQLRYQANAALVFGAEALCWGTWQDGKGWGYHNVYDLKVAKSEQYDKLKLVNAETRALGDRLMGYRTGGVRFLNFDGEYAALRFEDKHTQIKSQSNANAGPFTNICAADSKPLVVGAFARRSGGKGAAAVAVFAADDPYCTNHVNRVVRFSAKGPFVLSDATGRLPYRALGNGECEFVFESGDLVLMESLR